MCAVVFVLELLCLLFVLCLAGFTALCILTTHLPATRIRAFYNYYYYYCKLIRVCIYKSHFVVA